MSAMETAGKEDMPEDAERKGLGTPATRAGILEKLVSAGFLERKKSRKTVDVYKRQVLQMLTNTTKETGAVMHTNMHLRSALMRLSNYKNS